MSISLSKGQQVALVKPGGGTPGVVRMGLGWDADGRKGRPEGVRTHAVDLDASCMLFNAAGELVDSIWFRNLTSEAGAVVHSGDNVSGSGEGDDESITVDLAKVPDGVSHLVFTVNSFSGHRLSKVDNAFCRLVDADSGDELARYDLSISTEQAAQIMAKVSRGEEGWTMTAIGAECAGRTFKDLLPAVSPHL
ncbi:TerD family protein [Rhizohabitans arisaemae]|uniref:TerD family protein n=1 Tax=Rhizohabitans arisaemae TaxID=2720610 RepID=UPI0024B158ED|nr:TerD family protein [Rhizohabitans arisaemae]